ncbi:MAG TPA: putative Fe-S cluster assembly protein SufT [Candidatus Sulfotelmatobacter sp.]
MTMNAIGPIVLNRDCDVVQIPSGARGRLPAGSPVKILQSFSGTYTVSTDLGYMCRIDGKDADALGLSNTEPSKPAPQGTFEEKMVWDQLRTVYDPEIPVNIVDLGLIYSCVVSPADEGKKIEVKMSMTAPGCGMGDVLKADVQSKLSRLPEVKEVQVDVVFEPAWHMGLMSEAAKLQLGL